MAEVDEVPEMRVYSTPPSFGTTDLSKKDSLKKHRITYSEAKPFSCHTCRKIFKFAHRLKIHEKTHEVEKSFTLESCPPKSA